MNYKKIGQLLLEKGYIDKRMLMCHSNSNITSSKHYGLFVKFTTLNQDNLPSFVILSIFNNKLYISKAKMTGGFKESYAYIELNKMRFISKSVINMLIDSYKFGIKTEDDYEKLFYINASQKKYEAKQLVTEIINFNNTNKNKNNCKFFFSKKSKKWVCNIKRIFIKRFK